MVTIWGEVGLEDSGCARIANVHVCIAPLFLYLQKSTACNRQVRSYVYEC